MNVAALRPWQAATVPLADGETGTRQTLELVRKLVAQGVTHPLVRRTASDIVRHVPAYNDDAEVRAIFQWVLSNIRFTRDMAATWAAGRGWLGTETLQPAAAIITNGSGDCDDINAILLPALLGSIGYATRAVVIKADAADPENYSHVYLEVELPYGSNQWVALDAARPDAAFGKSPEYNWGIMRFPLTGGPLTGSEGFNPATAARRMMLGRMMQRGVRVRVRSLFPMARRGLRGLGQTPGGSFPPTPTLAQSILSSAPSIEQGAASIVAAANAPSYSTYGLAPGALPTYGGGLTLTGGTSSVVPWIVGGIALIGVVFALRR